MMWVIVVCEFIAGIVIGILLFLHIFIIRKTLEKIF